MNNFDLMYQKGVSDGLLALSCFLDMEQHLVLLPLIEQRLPNNVDAKEFISKQEEMIKEKHEKMLKKLTTEQQIIVCITMSKTLMFVEKYKNSICEILKEQLNQS